MKKYLIFPALLALCFGAFALPGLLSQEPVKIPDVKPTSPTSLELRNSLQKMTGLQKAANLAAKAPARTPAHAPQAIERTGDYSYISSAEELLQFTEFYGLDGDFVMTESDWSYSGRPLNYHYDNNGCLRVNLLGSNQHYLTVNNDSVNPGQGEDTDSLSIRDVTPANYKFNNVKEFNYCDQVYGTANISAPVWETIDGDNKFDNGMVVITGAVAGWGSGNASPKPLMETVDGPLLAAGTSLVDLGGEIGQVLCINGKNSQLNSRIQDLYGINLDIPTIPGDLHWFNINFFADPNTLPNNGSDNYYNVRVRLTFNLYHNSPDDYSAMVNGYPVGNQNNNFGEISNDVSPYLFTNISEGEDENGDSVAYYDWDPEIWMVSEFNCYVRQDEDGTSYSPIRLKLDIKNSPLANGAILIRSVEFFVPNEDEAVNSAKPINNMITLKADPVNGTFNNYTDNNIDSSDETVTELVKMPDLCPAITINSDGNAVISTALPLYADDNETWYLYAVDQNGEFVGLYEDIELWNYDGTIHFMYNNEELSMLVAYACDNDWNWIEDKYDFIQNAVICKPNTTISWTDENDNAYEDRIYSFLQNDKFTISRLPILYQTYAIDFDYINDMVISVGAPVYPSIAIDESTETGDFLLYGLDDMYLKEVIGYCANDGYDIEFGEQWLLYTEKGYNFGFQNPLHISLDYQLRTTSESPSLKNDVPYLVGYFCDWSFYPENEMTQIADNIYEIQGVNLPANDEFKIASPDWSNIDLGSYETPLAADQVYTLTERGGNMYLGTELVNANIIVNLSTKECMIRTDGGHTIEYNYTVYFDNANTNWSNVTAAVFGNNNSAEITMLAGENDVWTASFSLSWNAQSIIFYTLNEDGVIANETDEFELVNNATYSVDGRQRVKIVVVVDNEYELWSKLENVVLDDVEELKVIGPLSYDDLYNIRYNLNNVEIVDLGEAIFGELPERTFQNKAELTQVILPSSLTNIGAYAFRECNNLTEVTFNGECNVQFIGEWAFTNCYKLKTFDLSKVSEIYYESFINCHSLNNIDLSNVRVIYEEAFAYCNSLEEVVLESIEYIYWGAFYGCTGLQSFKCNQIERPYADDLDPTDQIYESCTLYVPLFALEEYANNWPWSNFYNIQPIVDEPIQSLRIERAIELPTLGDYAAALDGCDVTLGYNMSYNDRVAQVDFTNGGDALQLGTLAIEGYLDNRNNGRNTYLPSMITEDGAVLSADSVSVTLKMRRCSNWDTYWHFVSLPFDVRYDDITSSENSLFVLRSYNCEARALGDFENTWQNIGKGDIISANTGFIVSVFSLNESFPAVTFSCASEDNKDAIFNSSAVRLALSDIEAEWPQNSSWNFIGNPYPAYFDISQLTDDNGDTFSTPFTIWRGYSYESYCALDDELLLRPFEGLLLQSPNKESGMNFLPEGLYHWNAAYNWSSPGIYAPERLNEMSQREVFNFTASCGDELSNRARIVINEDAMMNYEIGRDATKFFETANNCPLIYINGDVMYSICERPLSDGVATLGFSAAKDDTYKLSLSGKHANGWQVLLQDRLTGAQIDLMENDYEFEAKAGQDDSRFTVKFSAPIFSNLDSILNSADPHAIVSVTSIAGVIVYQGALGQMPKLSAGIYLFTINGATSKISINQ